MSKKINKKNSENPKVKSYCPICSKSVMDLQTHINSEKHKSMMDNPEPLGIKQSSLDGINTEEINI